MGALRVYNATTSSWETVGGVAMENLPFTQIGALTVKTGVSRYPITGGAYSIQSVAAMVNTAPAGASIILDVKKNGTTIFGTSANRPTIAAGTTTATVGAFSVSSLTTGDYLTVDIVQIGSTTPGSDLVLAIRILKT